jgi:purine-binding chemotaxis protein CheW
MAYDDREDDFDDEQSLEHTYLIFAVGAEEYAIPVANVTEIVRLQKVFSVPDVARHVRGVINLRGNVIPLLDVRARFGLEATAYNDRTVIVVIELGGTPTGLVVDAVFDIAEYPEDQVAPPPALSQRSGREHLITGIGKSARRLSFILDVHRLIEADAAPDTTEAPREMPAVRSAVD